MELGLYSFAELPLSADSTVTPQQRLAHLMEEIKLADELALDVYAIGEHHRPEFLASAPAVILGAAASVTKNIKLSSAVTVLSSDDPVRVFQQFATVDLLSNGRAEIMAGRGSFIESFPLFGYNLNDYDELFSEKLELLLKLNESEKVSWRGNHRAAINNLGVYPRPANKKIPIWIAIGGTPESAVRAGSLGLPMALAIIGGTPQQFVPVVNLFRRAAADAGHDATNIGMSINSHMFIGDDSKKTADEFFPPFSAVMAKIGRERGWQPMTREQYDYMLSPKGALLIGSPQQVIDKILYEHELFKMNRFLAYMSVGAMEHMKVMRSIELFGTVVAPAVRKALGGN
ncbi:MAG TPA: LLM class flavin-dependent oxidoreductase [Bacteroidetes bacterium]|nr:LLM class flavin-dependent oxidoreductase [Bacteroidota bacterium]